LLSSLKRPREQTAAIGRLEQPLRARYQRGKRAIFDPLYSFHQLCLRTRAARPSDRLPALSVDSDTVRRIAHLSRIRLDEARIEPMRGDLNAILAFIEQLNEVDTDGVEPMTSVVETKMRLRADVVNDGNKADDIVANAPVSEDGFFMVPKVVE
jgi:aspartyl-tRNA(Asn)/glutamyl-tRNA(Gln) amidotransferase subunit C